MEGMVNKLHIEKKEEKFEADGGAENFTLFSTSSYYRTVDWCQ